MGVALSGPEAEPETAKSYVRPGFDWRSADCFLFDIDGTLLNSRGGVHYHAFSRAFREIWKIEETIDGVPWHGNTDVRIIRAVAARAGVPQEEIRLEELCRVIGEELERTRQNMESEACPAIPQILRSLHADGKVLGVASGNIECAGWAKIESCGLRNYFLFGAFSGPGRESREEIFALGLRMAQTRGCTSVHVVGDTPNDIRAARAVGIPVIAVATGKYGYNELRALQPDMVVECFRQEDLQKEASPLTTDV